MPLDSQIAAVLATMQAGGATPIGVATPYVARQESRGWLDFVGEPEPVASVEHDFITTPTAEIPVRIYRPKNTLVDPAPGLVFFHGSGWTIANIAIADNPHRMLANRTGCVVVAPNYQKAPERPYPIPLDDCTAAFEWTIEHADRLGIDRAIIGVGGDSAGGNLAAALCLRQVERGLDVPAFQVLVYPAVDCGGTYPSHFENAEGYLLTREAMAWFWSNYTGEFGNPSDPFISPMCAANFAGQPPALVLTAEFDPLRDEGEAYAARLRESGIDATCIRYDGQVHAFMWMAGVADISERSMNDIAAWIRSRVPS